MILGSDETKEDVAHPPPNAVYPVEIHGETYNLHDIVGLGKYTDGVGWATAAGLLYRLVADLSNADGINLLVYVVSCNADTMRKNYSLVHEIFCNSEVPIIIVVTGCENVGPTMDSWWSDNEASFTKVRMSFNGHACICAFQEIQTRDGGYRNKLIEDSVEAVRRLVAQHCRSKGWKMVCFYPQSSKVQKSLKCF
jgi:hypothetical protein